MLDITPQRYIPIFVLFCCALDLQSGANTAQVLVFGRNSARVERAAFYKGYRLVYSLIRAVLSLARQVMPLVCKF